MLRDRSRDLHRVVVEFDDGSYLKRLVHPEGGCQTADRCGQCARAFDDTETEPCYDCKPPIPDSYRECWVQGWFDNLTAEELLSGSIELSVDPEWRHDSCLLHIVDAKIPEREESR